MPGFNEIPALSLHLYKLAGHDSEKMTHTCKRNHADVVWSEVQADLDICGIAR